MKILLTILAVVVVSSTVSAQSLPKVSQPDVKSNLEQVTEQVELSDDQIKEALMKDEDLQTETISFLKKNPDTKSAMAQLAMGGMGASLGSSGGLMKSILGNQSLATAAISFIQSKPDLLAKAMKVLGL